MSQLGQIIYNNIKISLERNWNEAEINNQHRRTDQESEAGVEEFLNYIDRDFITMVKERITAHELQQLKQWYEYVKDGTAFEFLRDRDLGGFWEFEKTLNNNDLVALTFTRTAGTAGNASYTDPSTGLLTFENTLNTPRYDSGKWGHGLVIEDGRTNLIDESEDFSDAGWAKTNITASDDTTEVKDPEGNNTASLLTATAGNGIAKYNSGVAQGGDDGVFSIYVRCASGTIEGEIQIGSTTPSTDTTVAFTATPEWQRIQAAAENAGGANWEARVQIDTNNEIIYVYGAQLEVGTDVLFASNLIKTDGATKARNAERAKLAPTNIIGNLKGTIMMWFKSETQTFDKQANQFLYEHGDSGGGDGHSKIVLDSAGRLECTVTDTSGNAITALASLTSVFAAGAWAHIAMTYDSTASNGVKGYYNGVLLVTSSSSAFVPKADQDFFNIGTNRQGNFPAFGVFDEVLFRKDVLDASQIKRIYDMGRGLGEVRNRWASVILNNPEFVERFLRGINRFNFEISMREKIT